MALALYRKYRPATFEDLLGQELVSRILREAARQDRLAHAYLFAGTRGTGKTTTARLVAKIANCEKRRDDPAFVKTGEPCNKCRMCVETDEGRNLDTVEIDAASARGIDDIRDLRENVRTAPSSGRRKVFIIDEAHQLTKDAWNALLKTLEEPPEYAIIILATTEAERVPVTIASRAQQFFFKRVPLDEIAKKLSAIAKAEGIEADRDALELVAASAEGSFRDAESLLGQLVTFGDKRVTLADVEFMVGKAGFGKVAAFAESLLDGDAESALDALSRIHDSGTDIVRFAKDTIVHLRRVAVLKHAPAMRAALERELMEEHVVRIAAQSAKFEPRHLALLKSLIVAHGQMKYSQFPIIPLEVAVMESAKK